MQEEPCGAAALGGDLFVSEPLPTVARHDLLGPGSPDYEAVGPSGV